ncbi:MAG: hypothetical protein A2X35_06940 [Elusimicrobia bacterium GWA2_61_42]|nr:MAG: hypothetical protein A2X35_06940 [Elusimicrobia bacterium GWA2_61_42]OGR78361.1 MAG: hypothetical protein A2X38_05595 [Elusimicrobia bacterium GWC2_61_25]
MTNILKAVAAGLLIFNFGSAASAAGGALDDLGSAQAVEVPEAPAQAAPAEAREQAPDIDLFRYFGYAETPRAMELPEFSMQKGVKGVADTVASVDLESIRNAYLKPAVTFTTGAGTKVHVSGTKASNCPDGGNSCADKEKFFLVLTTSKGETFFARAMDILNWGFIYSGSKTFVIDGEKYVVKVQANASTPENSKLEVKGPKGLALSSTLKQVGDGVAAKGVDVKLSKAYKLAYGNEIVQGPQGAKFTSKMLVLMIPFPVVDASSYFILNAAEIKPAGTTFPSFEKGYGFKLEGGKLDIYRL